MTKLELADRYEREGFRIASGGIDRLGVRRVDAATAHDCFAIAAALRAQSTSHTGGSDE